MPTAQINDASIYYETVGKGQAIILVAGYTCDHSVWNEIAEILSRQFQVILFDNRGTGQTQDRNVPLSAELMANDVIQLAAHLELKKPHIIGQSMGGTITQAIAARYADKIGKLCILTSSAKWRNAMLLGYKSLLAMRENNENFDRQFEAGIPWLFSDHFLNDKNKLLSYKNTILAHPFPTSLENQQRQFNVLETFNGTTCLHSIKSPTLIIYGAQDIVALPDESHYLAANITHSSLLKFDTGHCILLEAPVQISNAIMSFLK